MIDSYQVCININLLHVHLITVGENIDSMPNTAVGGTCTNHSAADAAEGERCTH